jgi:hypothetical protein
MINTMSDDFLAERRESLIFVAVELLRPKAVGQYRQIGCPTYGIPWRRLARPPRSLSRLKRKKLGGQNVPCLATGATAQNKKVHPLQEGFFHAEAIVVVLNALAQLVPNPRGLQRWSA